MPDRRWRPVVFSDWHDIINDHPAMVASCEDLVYVLASEISHVSELCSRFLVVQSSVWSATKLLTIVHGSRSRKQTSHLCLRAPTSGSTQLPPSLCSWKEGLSLARVSCSS